MTETLISLISILIGIIGANSIGLAIKKHSFGVIGNTISGVFGSILFIKAFGKLGFDPLAIMEQGTFHSSLFIINCLVSFTGGVLVLMFLKKVYTKMNKKAAN